MPNDRWLDQRQTWSEHLLTVDDPISAGFEVEAPGVDIQRSYWPLIVGER